MNPSGAVFLSYASQDAEAAKRICEALGAAGIEVWFDQSELTGGDAWDRKIREQIAACALFVPVISAATQARHEGYFRLEWKLAAQRTHMMSGAKAFLLPVVIDATRDAEAHVPEEFRAVQWTRLPDGGQAEKFGARVKKLLDGGSVAGVADPGPASARPATARAAGGASPVKQKPAVGRRVPAAALIVAACVVVVAALLWQRRNETSSPSNAGAGTRPPTAETPLAAPVVNDKSLVVLPLENLSPDPANAFFTDGMHREVISTLSRITDLKKVISRESAVTLMSVPGSLADKARQVGVANVITGSVRREGTRVLVALELRRAHDETLLWSQRYDKQLGEGVLAIQADIAEQVARALQARERKGTYAGAQFMTANPQAFDLFLKASQIHYAERNAAGRQKAIAGLEQAFALDQNFSSAARLLAVAHIQSYLVAPNTATRLPHAHEAKRWAETARRLHPDGPCDAALAGYYSLVEPDNGRALALAESAVKALPNDAAVLNTLGIALSSAGRSAEAAVTFRQVIALDPLNRIFRGNLLRELAVLRRTSDFAVADSDYRAIVGADASSGSSAHGRFRLSGTVPAPLDGMRPSERIDWLQVGRRDLEALTAIDAALTAADTGDYTRWRLWIQKCDSLRRLRREADLVPAAQEAKGWMEKLNAQPALDPSEQDGRLATTLARLGRADEAIAAGRRYVAARSPENQVRARWEREIELAQIYAYLARPRECGELLAKLLRVPSGLTVPMLKVDPVWDNVREDAAFKALLADPKNSAPL